MCAGSYTFANSVELDETACNEPSHKDLFAIQFWIHHENIPI